MSEALPIRFRDEAGGEHTAEAIAAYRTVRGSVRIALLTNVDGTGEDGSVLESFLVNPQSNE